MRTKRSPSENPPKAAREEGERAFGIPLHGRALLPVREVAEYLGYEHSAVYVLLESGALEGHRSPDEPKAQWRITRRSLLAHQARTANYDPADFLKVVILMIDTLSSEQRVKALARLSAKGAGA